MRGEVPLDPPPFDVGSHKDNRKAKDLSFDRLLEVCVR